MNRRPVPAVCALLLAVALAAGCGKGGEEDAKAAVRRTPVTTATAVRQRVDAIETTVGRIEATAAPALAAETSGRVVRLHVDGGSAVRKGQVLAELDGEPQRLAVASARASVERLEALLANQQRTVNRYQELRSKAVSESMLEEAIAQQSAREAELNDAVAELADFFLPEAERHGVRLRVERSPQPIRAVVDVFEPPAAPVRRLTAGIKASFDPRGIFNPGRMYAGT